MEYTEGGIYLQDNGQHLLSLGRVEDKLAFATITKTILSEELSSPLCIQNGQIGSWRVDSLAFYVTQLEGKIRYLRNVDPDIYGRVKTVLFSKNGQYELTKVQAGSAKLKDRFNKLKQAKSLARMNSLPYTDIDNELMELAKILRLSPPGLGAGKVNSGRTDGASKYMKIFGGGTCSPK